MMSLRTLILPLNIIALSATGCLEEGSEPIEPDSGAPDADEPSSPVSGVDLLFVIDNSNSMQEEQRILREQVDVLLRGLIKPEGEDEGAPVPIDDLHVGVVTTDMGSGGVTLMTCTEPFVGDNGVMQNTSELPECQPSYSAADCDRDECPWLSHSTEHPAAGEGGTSTIWEELGCIATLGTEGCGFEQQFEAALAALTEQSEPGGVNEGFLRGDSLLVVVLVTDEDDCSTPSSEFFDPNREDLGCLCLRCMMNEDLLYPIERYRDSLLALRGGDESRVVLAAVTGIPTDGSWHPGDGVERLQNLRRVDPENPTSQIPICSSSHGLAFPAVRIATLVEAFGENGIISSICRSDWTDTFRQLANLIHLRMAEGR
jgi:hypothetical protein